jgi:hypothetical protein
MFRQLPQQQLESPRNRLVYSFLRDSADCNSFLPFAALAAVGILVAAARQVSTIQRLRQLVQQSVQVFVRLPLLLNLIDRMHHCSVVLAAKLTSDFRQ